MDQKFPQAEGGLNPLPGCDEPLLPPLTGGTLPLALLAVELLLLTLKSVPGSAPDAVSLIDSASLLAPPPPPPLNL